MPTELVRTGIGDHRRGLLAWSLGIVGYIALIAAIFPSIEGSPDFDALIESYPEVLKSLFGLTEGADITSGPGFLDVELFSFMLPLLVLVANIIGVMGGWLIATWRLGFNSAAYLETTARYLEWEDVRSSLVKAAVFGFIIALSGCYAGYRSAGGAAGVGRATTDAVVTAFILILLANLVITVLVFGA